MPCNDSVLVTGAGGVLGTALVKQLRAISQCSILAPSKSELNCLDAQSVESYFSKHKPKQVFHLASLVYGIKGNINNQYASFLQNITMSLNVLDACQNFEVDKVFYAGTVASYAYPYKHMPLLEGDLLNGVAHRGEYGYAMAKRSALAQLEIMKEYHGVDYVYGVLTNLYGENDKFDTENGHVIPSLIVKAHAAECNSFQHIFKVWGRPDVTRDFMYSADAASAIILLMEKYSGTVNIGTGIETSMGELVDAIVRASPQSISAEWQADKPVGIERRVSDVGILKSLGYYPKFSLSEGIEKTFDWYRDNINKSRG